jgi:hypothetical protein
MSLLLRISQQLEQSQLGEGNVTTSPLPATDAHPSTKVIYINAAWFLSLASSIFAAIVGIPLKQWLRSCISWTEVLPLEDIVTLQRIYSRDFKRYCILEVCALLQAFLQLSLILFLVGLFGFLWLLETKIFITLVILILLLLLVYYCGSPTLEAMCSL